MNSMIRKPSAWIPVVLSLIMLATILGVIIRMQILHLPIVHEADEGVMAHLFQIWLVLEAFLILFFAVKWLPERPRQAVLVLIIQIIAVFVTCFPVFYFGF